MSQSPVGQQEVLSLTVYDRGPQICSPDTQSCCMVKVKVKNSSVCWKEFILTKEARGQRPLK